MSNEVKKIELMNNSELKKLALRLRDADHEDKVTKILEEYGVQNDLNYWRTLGDIEGNSALVGNQQDTSDKALVEKLTNSIDAILMRKCHEAGIDPKSNQAPASIQEALEIFCGFNNGSFYDHPKIKELAKNIQVVFSGKVSSKQNPCISIIDNGEGQTPSKFPDTFLSLLEKNKSEIQFVQGKYNMGGTGALRFAGEHNYQLILSKRAPHIADRSDETYDFWGFTLIKRFEPEPGERNETYRYLVINNEVPKFKATALRLRPENYGEGIHHHTMTYGTYIRLYNYEMPSGFRANVYKDFSSKLNTLLPEPALPISVYERRPYSGEAARSTGYVFGMRISFMDNKKQNLAFSPYYGEFDFHEGIIPYHIYAFNKEDYKQNISKDAIFYSINGQTHGTAGITFFSRNGVGLGHIKRQVMMIVDCSNIPRKIQRKIFMPSRDRLANGPLKSELEKSIEQELSKNKELKAFQEKIKSAKASRISTDDRINEAIMKVINQPLAHELFYPGRKLYSKDNYLASQQEEYEGKHDPTYFNPDKNYHSNKPKYIGLGSSAFLKFNTNAANNFFERPQYPGELQIVSTSPQITVLKYTKNLRNGIASSKITLDIDPSLQIGDQFELTIEVSSPTMHPSIQHSIICEFVQPVKKQSGSGRKKEIQLGKGPKGLNPDGRTLDDIKINPVTKEDWGLHHYDEEAIGHAIRDRESFSVYVNIDNIYLTTKRLYVKDDQKAKFRFGLELFVGVFSVMQARYLLEKGKEEELEERTRALFNSLGPAIIPMFEEFSNYEDKLHE